MQAFLCFFCKKIGKDYVKNKEENAVAFEKALKFFQEYFA